MFDVTDDKVVFNRKGISIARLGAVFGVFLLAIPMLILGIYMISTVDLEENVRFWVSFAAYAVPIALLIISSVFVLGLPVLFFFFLRDALYTYVFDKVGVHRVSPFGEIIIPWKDLKDYGFSFEHTNKDYDLEVETLLYQREYGKTYMFYFSDKEADTQRHERKDLKNVKIKWSCSFLNQEQNWDYYAARKDGEVYRIILDFCSSHTDVKPFIPVTIEEYLYPKVESPTSRFL